jgi:type IV pilus assembly protein PilA
MSSQIKAKLLQHFAGKKKANGGFTLIELLVVIIIIGILSAIALPSFLNQANKAKQSEAKTYIGSMNRAQQAYYLEANTFAGQADFGKLGLGISPSTTNYDYTITVPTTTGAIGVTNQGKPKTATSAVKAYVGGVEVGTVNATEATTLAVLCEAKASPATAVAAGFTVANVNGGQTVTYGAASNTARCGANYTAIN